MTRQRSHQLTQVRVGDDATSWMAAGFSVTGAAVHVAGVAIQLVSADAGRGVQSVTIDGVAVSDGDLDGVALHASPGERSHHDHMAHPNGVEAIDHLVMTTPDCDRTTRTLERLGIAVRRVRRFELAEVVRRQTFFWLGDVILELVGPDEASGDGPAEMWGFAFTSSDLDNTALVLGSAAGRPKPAVQPGRSILTVRTNDLDVSTAIAVMSPHSHTQH